MLYLIGSKIKDLRKSKNIRQQDLVCDILNRSILSEIENNKMYPSIPQLHHICNVLQVPIDYFLCSDLKGSDPQSIEYDNHSIIESLFNSKDYLRIVELYELNKLKLTQDKNKYFYVGISYFHINLQSDSLKMLKRYLNDYSKFQDKDKNNYAENYAIALNILSSIMSRNSNYQKIFHYLYLAKRTLEEYNRTKSKIYFIISNNIGSYYCISQKYDLAISFLEDFFKKNTDLFFLSILPSMHLSLNIAYYKTNQFKEAIIHIQRAITFFEYTNKDFDAAECYLNYINSLRFDYRYDEALLLICQLKNRYKESKELINLFTIQEMVINFNLKKYEDVLEISKKIKLAELRKKSKIDFYFIIGHINFINGNYRAAYNYLSRCEKYLFNRNYFLDLKKLYEDFDTMQEQGLEIQKKHDIHVEYHVKNICT